MKRTLLMLLLVALLATGASAQQQQLNTPGHPIDFEGLTNIGVFLVYYQDTDYQDNPGREYTPDVIAQIDADLFGPQPSVSDLFDEMSFGQDQITGTILGPYTVPFDGHKPGFGDCGAGAHRSWAENVLTQADPNGTIYSVGGSGGYDLLMFIYPSGNDCDGSLAINGVAVRSGTLEPDELPYTTILNWRIEQTMAHELGHLKGWNHAQILTFPDGYGDHSCVMGDNYAYLGHPDYWLFNPQNPPAATPLKMRQGSAVMKIHAGYIDQGDLYFATPSSSPQTVYLAPTEMNPLDFPEPPGSAPIYHAAAIDLPTVDRKYVVSFRHQSLSPYNLEFSHLMGRVHVHSFGGDWEVGDVGDVILRDTLAAGESVSDDFLTVTAVGDCLNGENCVAVTIEIPEHLPAKINGPTRFEESNATASNSGTQTYTVRHRGPSGSVTFDLGVQALPPEISGAIVSPSQITLANPNDSASVDVQLQFSGSTLAEGEYEFELVASDPSGDRDDATLSVTYFNDTSGPVVTSLVGTHLQTEVQLSWESDRPDDSFELTRDGQTIAGPGSFRSHTDGGVLPGSAHDYCVIGTDKFNHPPTQTCIFVNDPCTFVPLVSVNPQMLQITQQQGSGLLGTFVVTVQNPNPSGCPDIVYSVAGTGSFPGFYSAGGGNVTVSAGSSGTANVGVSFFNPGNPREKPQQGHFDVGVVVSNPITSNVTIPGLLFAYDYTDPGLPQNPVACLTGSEVSLSWAAANDNDQVSHYEVYDADDVLVETTTNLGVVDATLLQELSYEIYAVDFAGNLSAAQTVSASRPTLSISLAEPSPTNEASPGFSVIVQNDNAASCPDVTYSLAGINGAGYTVSVDSSLMVSSQSSAAASGTLNPSQDGTFAFEVDVDGQLVGGSYTVDTTNPTAPSKIVGGSGPGIAFFSWVTAKDHGGSGVVEHRIYRNGAFQGTVSGTTYVDTSAPAARPLTYTIRGVDAAGNVGAPGSITFRR